MQLSEEHLLIREMAQKFAAEELMPTAGGRDKSAAFPASELKDMGALGLMGMLTPENGAAQKLAMWVALLCWKK